MGKRSSVSAEERMQLGLRVLSKEEPAVQVAHGPAFPRQRCIAGGMSFSKVAAKPWPVGRGRKRRPRPSSNSSGRWRSGTR
jgi:hypothetical protein